MFDSDNRGNWGRCLWLVCRLYGGGGGEVGLLGERGGLTRGAASGMVYGLSGFSFAGNVRNVQAVGHG